ncbi:SCP2 sterol-binding domain-containing protein [Brackiella oedipodis]|uniref:SCP2 sterol-binding domain-containing protein n=1 Tax=Brackiella oedipodis TaxID=124225 RepID=UPI0004900B73|nr:hypothetical protein [Brackiella oedipodis]
MFSAFLPSPKQLAVAAFNRLIQQEPWAQQRIAQQAHKTVKFVVADKSLCFKLTPEGRLHYLDKPAESPTAAVNGLTPQANVTVTVAREDIPKLVQSLSQGPQGMQNAADVLHISGEAGLARLVSDLATHLRLDKEVFLSQFLGPLLTKILMASTHKVQQTGLEGAQHLASHLSQEDQCLVDQAAFQDFKQDLHTLQDSLKPLEAQIRRLERQG